MERIQFLDGFTVTPRLSKLADKVISFFQIEQLASHGDHLPTESPEPQPVVGYPPAQRWEQ